MNIFSDLENKIDSAIETIELLRLQLEESEQEKINLQAEVDKIKLENITIKEKYSNIETNLSSMLQKLDSIENQEEVTQKNNMENVTA